MKFLSVFAFALLSVASARSTVGSSQKALTEEKKNVPGENPLQFCADPEKDILELERVDLDPNPPLPGQPLEITAVGNLTENVEEGAKIHLSVKYGLITIIKQTADLCDTVKNVDLSCPLKKGKLNLTKNVELPKEIPPGKYTVFADVLTKDEEKITCLTAQITFSRKGEATVHL